MSIISSPDTSILLPPGFNRNVVSTVQNSVLGNGIFSNPTTSSSVSYMLDGVSGVALAYSLRKLKSTSSLALTAYSQSDVTSQDVGFFGEDFDFNTWDTFNSSASGIVGCSNWYDQSGNGKNAVQATDANQPLFSQLFPTDKSFGLSLDFSSVISPKLSFTSTSFTNFTILSVFSHRANPTSTNTQTIISGNASTDLYVYVGRGTTRRLGSTQNTRNRYAQPSVMTVGNGYIFTITSSSVIDQNSSSQTLVTTDSISGSLNTIGTRNSNTSNERARGLLVELIIFDRVLDSTEIASFESNISSYWSLTA